MYKQKWFLLFVIMVAFVILVNTPGQSLAATCQWTGDIDTDWDTAGNWADCLGGVPGSGDSVVIPNVTNQLVISAATTAAIGGLTINTGASVTVEGTLTLQGVLSGAGVTFIQIAFNNTGTVQMQTGELKLTSGTSSGSFEASTGATLNLSGQTLDGSANLIGAGTITGSGVAIAGASVTVGSTFTLQGAIWAGELTVNGTMNISGDTDKSLNPRTLNNNGTVTWTGAGNINSYNSAINNLSGATFDVQNNAVIKLLKIVIVSNWF